MPLRIPREGVEGEVEGSNSAPLTPTAASLQLRSTHFIQPLVFAELYVLKSAVLHILAIAVSYFNNSIVSIFHQKLFVLFLLLEQMIFLKKCLPSPFSY